MVAADIGGVAGLVDLVGWGGAEGALWMLAAAIAGGVGAVARYVIDTVVTRIVARRGRETVLPWGTLVVNLTGSFAIGVLIGWAHAQFAGTSSGVFAGGFADVFGGAFAGVSEGAALGYHPVWLVIGVGLLGGYTTLSTASLDTVKLLQRGRVGAAVVNGIGQLLVAVVAALLGIALGSLT